MLKRLETVAERALALFVPRATAGAWCTPQNYCQSCDHWPGRSQRVYIYADCSVLRTECRPGC